MKKLFRNMAFLLSAAVLTSCICDTFDDAAVDSDTQGVANITLRMPAATRALDYGAYPWKDDCDIRIYKKTETLGKELIRHYFGPDELPAQLWLLEGTYVVKVSLGRLAAATFDKPSYEGEQEFEIMRGLSTDVEVQCNLLNTIIEVNADATIGRTFDKGWSVDVLIADEFSRSAMTDNNSLTYTESRRGYFILPADADKFSFCFKGYSSNPKVKDKDGNDNPDGGEIHEHFVKSIDSDKTAGYLYRLNLKYSKDAEGFLDCDFEVELAREKAEDDFVAVNPSPRPTIGGSGFNISETKDVRGELRYELSSQSSEIKTIQIACEGQTFSVDCQTASYAATNVSGIEIERDGDDNKELTLILGKAFFDNFTGGEHTLQFTVTCANNADGTARSKVRTPGVFSLAPTDKWNARGEIRAYLFDESAGSVEVRYRAKNGGDWKTVEASDGGEGVWTAQCTEINAETDYEYQLLVDSVATGAVAGTTTDSGPQVPNADFEIWSTISGVLCPYLADGEQWWSSGNAGAKTAGKTLTSNVTDIPEGASGQYAARLASDSAIGVLASGNIYLGEFVGTKNITKGVVRFGHSFDFTYRPKALKFWYKGEVGSVDICPSGTPDEISKGSTDVQQIYILLCAMDGPHLVDTGDTSTYINLDGNTKTISYCTTKPLTSITTSSKNDAADAHIIAWGRFEPKTSYESWTEINIDLTYNNEYEGEVPMWLMITASANKYGDYYGGCSSNKIFLDEMKLAY